jgi:hypothetical protein
MYDCTYYVYNTHGAIKTPKKWSLGSGRVFGRSDGTQHTWDRHSGLASTPNIRFPPHKGIHRSKISTAILYSKLDPLTVSLGSHPAKDVPTRTLQPLQAPKGQVLPTFLKDIREVLHLVRTRLNVIYHWDYV